MTLLEIISLYGGGQGSGCNPAVGHCGRMPSGVEKALSQKAQNAKDTYKPMTSDRYQLAKRNERSVAKILGGMTTANNSPFDIIVKGKIGIEIKTLIDQTNDKITMHPESLARKVAGAKKLGLKSTYTVAIDNRTGKPQVYYRAGLGSFRLGNMESVKGLNDLKKVVK